MTHAEALQIVNRCGGERAPPVPGKLVHAWKGWATHEGPGEPEIIYSHKEVSEARRIVRGGA